MGTTLAEAALGAVLFTASPALSQPSRIEVSLGEGLEAPRGGRLLVFAAPTNAENNDAADVQADVAATWIAGQDVERLTEGARTTIDAEEDAFPTPLSRLPAGRYRFQAVLDQDRSYGVAQRGGGDLVSSVAEAQLPGPLPQLILDRVQPDYSTDFVLSFQPVAIRSELRTAFHEVSPIAFPSKKLAAFSGQATSIRAHVVVPPDYDSTKKRYPVAYVIGGFDSVPLLDRLQAAFARLWMKRGEIPPIIWVFLDHGLATGKHEFADSVNNGPWASALIEEFAPWFDREYRTKGAKARYVTGHSSGGWAALWLQTRYPREFAGVWSVAPDPVDFTDFTNVDIYAAEANAYRLPDGSETPLMREGERVSATFRQMAHKEAVLAPIGGQLASFEWVFSPRGPDGRPLKLFDRRTGEVDSKVAAHWRDNYDISYRLRREWPRIGGDLRGKVRVIVGDVDTFYLDRSVRRLEAGLKSIGADARFTYLPGRDHYNVLAEGGDRRGLWKVIAKEMGAAGR